MTHNSLVHIASVADGSIISFPSSRYAYMKVCDKNGVGGVVRLTQGKYIANRDLDSEGLGTMCKVHFACIDDAYRDDSDDDEDEDDMRESQGNNWW